LKILIVEDSERLRRSLHEGLRECGFVPDLAADGEQALAYLDAYRYEVVVLDLLLPKRSGLEVLAELRARGDNTHVLILSAKDQVEDRVRGLELGADDYLVKPFAFDELVARLRALGRRGTERKDPKIRIGPIVIDTARAKVYRRGDVLDLTRGEYALLAFLAARRGRVFSQDSLRKHLYPSESDVSSNVVEVTVSGLRKKLDAPGEPSLIRTRRGFGYVIEGPEA
jgi:two-component system copper resistance phosphate regulon response regulator CusR